LAACPGPFGGADTKSKPASAPASRNNEPAAPPAAGPTKAKAPNSQFRLEKTGIFVDPGGGVAVTDFLPSHFPSHPARRSIILAAL
jgi:hypothetical protein